MAEAQEQTQEVPSENQRPYESLIADNDYTDSVYNILKDLGVDVDYNNKKDIVDSFLLRKRFFENNLLAAPYAKSVVDDMSDDNKVLLGYALKETEKIPTIGEGSAPLLPKLRDYFLAGVSDPTNLLSAVAAAFTLGSGGAAALAAKEAGRQGFKKYINAKIKAAVSKPALASYAVEGTVAGTGGAATNVINQKIQQEVGLRDKDDGLDISEAALQGIIEGVASPVIGVVGNVAGGAGYQLGKRAGRKTLDLLPENAREGVESGVAWMERNLLPAGATTEDQRRLVERQAGQVSSLKDVAENLQQQFTTVLERDFEKGDYASETSLINKALEGDKNSLTAIAEKSEEAGKVIDDFFNLRERAYTFANESGLNKKTKGLFEKDPNYVRNVPEKWAVTKRSEKYEDFIKRNPDILDDLRQDMILNPENKSWVKYTNRYISKNDAGENIETLANDEVEKIIRSAGKDLYAPTKRFKKETGAFDPRKTVMENRQQVYDIELQRLKDMPSNKNVSVKTLEKKADKATDKLMKSALTPTIKKFIGYNQIPALRLTETINGIVDTASRVNVARDVAADGVRRGIAVSVPVDAVNPEAIARQQLGEDVIPLVGSFKKIAAGEREKNAAMKLPLQTIDDSLKNVYITKTEGNRIKELFDEGFANDIYTRSDLIGTTARILSGTQGLAKSGKTIYSPLSNVRNIVGAAGYTITSGNLRGLVDGAKYLSSLSKEARQEIIDEYTALGIRGSNIDLNQTLKRFGDISDKIDDGNLLERLVKSGGLAAFGKPGSKLAKKAQEFYGGVDDYFKGAAVFANEKRKTTKVFDSYSKEQQAAKLAEFDQTFNVGRGTSTKEDYIKEIAAQKTLNLTPVYGRIPKILEKMRAVPVLGSFTAYPAERIRNTYNLFKIATDEMREGFETGNKQLHKQGISRLGQWSAAQGALYSAAYAINEMNGFSDAVDALRGVIPEWDKNAAIVITGKDSKGMPKYVNLSYLHPDSQFLGAIAPVMLKASRGEDVSEDLLKTMGQSFVTLVEPYVDPSLAFQFSENMVEFAKSGFQDEQYLSRALGSISPGYLSILSDVAKDSGVYRKFGDAGSQVEQFIYPEIFQTSDTNPEGLYELLAKNGLVFAAAKEKTFNPERTMSFVFNQINKNYEGDRNKFIRDLTNDLADPRTEINAEKILEQYDDILQQQFVAQQAMMNLTRDMEKLTGKQDLFKTLKAMQRKSAFLPSKKSLYSIINSERFSPVRVSDKASRFRDINQTLIEKTGYNYADELNYLKRQMYNLEKFYVGKTLNGKPPEISIGE